MTKIERWQEEGGNRQGHSMCPCLRANQAVPPFLGFGGGSSDDGQVFGAGGSNVVPLVGERIGHERQGHRGVEPGGVVALPAGAGT